MAVVFPPCHCGTLALRQFALLSATVGVAFDQYKSFWFGVVGGRISAVPLRHLDIATVCIVMVVMFSMFASSPCACVFPFMRCA